MDVLISTSHGLGIVEGRKYHSLFKTSKLCYGLTWDGNKVYLISSEPENGGRNFIEVFEDGFKHVATIPIFECFDAHEAVYANGLLMVTNTGRHRVEIYETPTLEQFGYTSCFRNPKSHINSIWWSGDGWGIIEHNFSDRTSVPSLARLFDLNWNQKMVIMVGNCAHSLFVIDNLLYVCSSNRRRIIRNNMGNGEWLETLLDGWVRGLGCDGVSVVCSGSICAIRNKRHQLHDAKLFTLDMDLELKDSIDVPSVGQINAVRLIGSDDIAHNGIRL